MYVVVHYVFSMLFIEVELIYNNDAQVSGVFSWLSFDNSRQSCNHH